MNDTSWPERFETILRTYLSLLGPDDPITDDLSLNDHGLDSLGTVSLILDLEDAFDVVIPDELLTADTFTTPKQLWAMMAGLGAAGADG